MIKFLIPIIFLVIICLFAGSAGLKLLGIMALSAGAGVALFFLLRFLAIKFPKLFGNIFAKTQRKDKSK